MNIFVTDKCPVISARNLDDKRTHKMAGECDLMLAMPKRILEFDSTPKEERTKKSLGYRNNACSIWTRRTYGNYAWILQHWLACAYEYSVRYNSAEFLEAYPSVNDYSKDVNLGKIPKKFKVLKNMEGKVSEYYSVLNSSIPDGERQEWLDKSFYREYKGERPFDTITAYRMTLVHKWFGMDTRPVAWTNRKPPKFLENMFH